MSLLAAAVLGQALGVAQWDFFRPRNECRQDPDSFECFCENSPSHRVCRSHYFDLDVDDQDWVCYRFPDYRWCPGEAPPPVYSYFSAVVDYGSPQWQLELYYTNYGRSPAELEECAVTVVSQRGRFPLNRRIVFESENPFVMYRSQFGSPPLGSPRYVNRLRIECRLAGTGEVIRETLEVDSSDLENQRWATLR